MHAGFSNARIHVHSLHSSRSVAWLADEAYRRRQILTGQRSATAVRRTDCNGADMVRLSTRDGALLLHTDRLHSVLPALGQSPGSVIELLAELLQSDSGATTCTLQAPLPRVTEFGSSSMAPTGRSATIPLASALGERNRRNLLFICFCFFQFACLLRCTQC
ncbi:unnamed protein product [Echinostoma caproni]|uniref:Uncharacterized protein n=1 Tax=Echinostoma caproni TaxID=27848 RepID=A0A183AZA6_9TREM|nr:unnamed protein product [Echinostoma caproni]